MELLLLLVNDHVPRSMGAAQTVVELELTQAVAGQRSCCCGAKVLLWRPAGERKSSVGRRKRRLADRNSIQKRGERSSQQRLEEQLASSEAIRGRKQATVLNLRTYFVDLNVWGLFFYKIAILSVLRQLIRAGGSKNSDVRMLEYKCICRTVRPAIK